MNKFFSKRLKSFGLIEAVVASTIMTLILIGAAVLSSSTLKTSIVEENYHEAEHIADALMEKVRSAKESGLVVFTKGEAVANLGSDELFSADCFQTTKRDGVNCRVGDSYKEPLPYYDNVSGDMEGDYVLVKKHNKVKIPFDSSNFANGFFRWKMTVTRPASCQNVGPVEIDRLKCRLVQVDVRWNQPSGEKSYLLSQYFTDWSR